MFYFDENNRRYAEDLSDQEIFNLCSMHLGTMPHQAKRTDGNCAYRTEDNNVCALGFFISDREYNDGFEGLSILSLSDTSYNFPQRLLDHETIFYELQAIHDTEKSWHGKREYLRNHLSILARDNSLNSDVLANPALIWNQQGSI